MILRRNAARKWSQHLTTFAGAGTVEKKDDISEKKRGSLPTGSTQKENAMERENTEVDAAGDLLTEREK